MNTWPNKQIMALGRVVTGKTPPKDEPHYFDGDELFVSPKDMDWDQLYVEETETRISSKALEKFKNQVIPTNAVMYTSLSFGFGKIGVASRPCLTNQQISSVVVNDQNEFRFVYYLLKTCTPFIFSYNSGIDTPIVPKSVFERIELKCPEIRIQRKIAAILWTYDLLIENNRRQIAALEKMAEEIYREWFVRLRFPGHDKVKLVKGVPEGWIRSDVRSFSLSIRRGVAPIYDEKGTSLAINQKCIRGGKLSLGAARRQSREVSDDRKIRVGDVLVNSTGEGTLGRVAQVLVPIADAIVDSHVTIVRPKAGTPLHYFGMTLRSWEPHFSIMGSGSTNQTELAPAIIGRVQMLMPPEALADRFESMATPIFQQATTLQQQVKHLTQARDLLLPRLISGKLRVDDLDIQFPPSMREEQQ